MRQLLVCLGALLCVPAGVAMIPAGGDVLCSADVPAAITFTFSDGCAGAFPKVTFDGSNDKAGTSGATDTTTETGSDTCTITGSALDLWEVSGDVELDIDEEMTADVDSNSSTASASVTTLAGFVLTVTYTPREGPEETHIVSAGLEPPPNTWTVAVPGYNGDLTSLDLTLAPTVDFTFGFETRNPACHSAWAMGTLDASFEVSHH